MGHFVTYLVITVAYIIIISGTVCLEYLEKGLKFLEAVLSAVSDHSADLKASCSYVRDYKYDLVEHGKQVGICTLSF